jgi:lipopolysaccharide transport system ATP-binding protein
VLFVSHNMTSIKSLCNSCILLREGRITFKGDTDEAIQMYGDEWKEDRQDIPIAERSRNHGEQISLQAKIVGFKIVSEGRENPSVINSSKPFTAVFEIKTAFESVKCGAQFIISDDTQNLILCDSASVHGIIYQLKKGINRIECQVGPTYLYAGIYKIACVLSLPNQGVIDYVPDAYTFTVSELDPNNTGFNLRRRSNFAVYYVDHKWKVIDYN